MNTIRRINTVQVYRGRCTIVVTLDDLGDGRYMVGAARFYRTYQGARVEGTFERIFTDLDAARRYANGHWRHLRSQGWLPVPDKR